MKSQPDFAIQEWPPWPQVNGSYEEIVANITTPINPLPSSKLLLSSSNKLVMNTTFRLFILFLLIHTSPLFAQNISHLEISKMNGSYHKTIKLPVNLSILKKDDQVIRFRLDSIKNGYFFGNSDSISLGDIETVHLRGIKEIVKYTSLAACAAITFGATYFTIFAFNHPVVYDGNNEMYKYFGMGYMATFGGLGTTIYLYPRTRFKSSKYVFKTY